ncbi:MAG: hypothetical protein WDN26_02525 [Chitinophagaceae bacterium]
MRIKINGFIATSTTFIAIVIISCNSSTGKTTNTEQSAPVVEQLVFDKLVGTWQLEDGKNFERWTKNADGNFRSVAFTAKGTDTSWNEQANIYPEAGKWIFENTVKGQNDGKAVKFVSSLLTEKSVQFSNPAHDFPTDVNYTMGDTNTINAFIIGPNSKSGKDTIPFNYIRVK